MHPLKDTQDNHYYNNERNHMHMFVGVFLLKSYVTGVYNGWVVCIGKPTLKIRVQSICIIMHVFSPYEEFNERMRPFHMLH